MRREWLPMTARVVRKRASFQLSPKGKRGKPLLKERECRIELETENEDDDEEKEV